MKPRAIFLQIVTCSLALQCILTMAKDGSGANAGGARFGETYRAVFILEPTEFGPPDARGKMVLKWLDAEAFISVLQIQLSDLAPGAYQIVAGGAGGGFNTSIVIPTDGKGKFRTNIVFGAPFIVDPTVITRILVESNGVPVLIGDLEQPGRSTSVLHSTVAIAPGPAAPNATGVASWTRTFEDGQRTDRVSLNASGLPKNATFVVVFAGSELGQVTSNHQGRVIFHEQVSGLTGDGPLQLMTHGGGEALSASF